MNISKKKKEMPKAFYSSNSKNGDNGDSSLRSEATKGQPLLEFFWKHENGPGGSE